MRRIVVIAAGPAGVTCATRLKRRLPESEVNIILPPTLETLQSSVGPAGRRLAAGLPNLETLTSREVGILDARDIMPGLDSREVTFSSSRGRLTVRFEELVVETAATARLPRALQRCSNVFGWPMTGFAADPAACDEALARSARDNVPVLVAGAGMPALDAVFLAREAGAPVIWLCTSEKDVPDIEPHLCGILLAFMGEGVRFVPLPETPAESLRCAVSGDVLESVSLPDGELVACSCCLWTTPLMARHPLLREDGFFLNRFGCMEAAEGVEENLGVFLMGSGAALPPARLAQGAEVPAWPGGEEAALASAVYISEKLARTGRGAGASSARPPAEPALLGVRRAAMPGRILLRAGLTLADAERAGLEADHAILARPLGGKATEKAQGGEDLLTLVLVGHKQSGTLLGVQVLGMAPGGGESAVLGADGLFGMGLAALARGTALEELAVREAAGLPGFMLARAASMLANKFAGAARGISPDELLASAAAGAEFFTLDLRSKPEWEARRLPGAHNIPLPQLKKRIQDEVPRYTPLVLVCATGDDAYAAARRLAGLGATELYVLDGGMNLWPYPLG